MRNNTVKRAFGSKNKKECSTFSKCLGRS
ncbi:hypothetical protein Goari_002491 [Gossypium aridum]|uniref:Uncharacterized protein n=1 Tax=Gossypium aridum TaxID=34290 RepID=A0A7J8YA33_GOSAI|nr:hypothetical protein [Gossypium aridum]